MKLGIQDIERLQNCDLFQGIATDDFSPALQFLQAKIKILAKHEFLQALGEPFLYAGMVLEGAIEGSFLDERSEKVGVNRFLPGQTFGEALACLQPKESPIQLEALKKSRVLLFRLGALHQPRKMLSGYQYHLAMNLIHKLARQNLFQNQKVRIFGQKRLRNRLLVFLRAQKRDADGAINVSFTNTALAEFLDVNRSALSRELGQMQDEGLLRIDGKKFYLHTED